MLSRLFPISLNTFPKILQHMEGYNLTIWNSLESVLRLSKKFPGTFPVFQIVSYKLNYIHKGPQTHSGYVWTI